MYIEMEIIGGMCNSKYSEDSLWRLNISIFERTLCSCNLLNISTNQKYIQLHRRLISGYTKNEATPRPSNTMLEQDDCEGHTSEDDTETETRNKEGDKPIAFNSFTIM